MSKCGLRTDKRVKAKIFPVSVFVGIFILVGVVTTVQMMLIGDYIDVNVMEESWGLRAVFFLHWFILAAGGALWVGYQVNRRYQKPIEEFAEAARKVAGGDFSVYIPPRHTENKADSLDVIFSDFNKMVEELGSIETLKVDFFTNVSHEIKTPLAVIQSYAELLQKEGISERERMEYTAAIIESTHRLTNLINNMLKLNKLESQKIQSEPEIYNLCRQLEECVIGFEHTWDKKNIEIEMEMADSALIEADRALMELVWNNLISNALKFTEPGGKVKICQTSGGGKIIVSVSDTGCGMSEQTMKHIFDKFYQGDTSHAMEGNGLGLALVLRIAQLSDADIFVDSKEGTGTCFTVQLPAVLKEGVNKI